MPQWMQDLTAGWPMIMANLPTFFVLAALITGVVWWLMDWRYGGVIAGRDGAIANRDSEIALLKGQRDDYKDKLKGATPDQAKARIDALEARFASLEPRRLTTSQRAGLIARLTSRMGDVPAITIVSETSGDSLQFAADFASVFRASGTWNVSEGSFMGLGSRPMSGVAVRITDPPSRAATVVMNALRSEGIGFDIQQVPEMGLALLICPKIDR
jgi:hypothetical protein